MRKERYKLWLGRFDTLAEAQKARADDAGKRSADELGEHDDTDDHDRKGVLGNIGWLHKGRTHRATMWMYADAQKQRNMKY